MDATEARARAEEKIREVHERLTGAVEALTTGDQWRRALEFAARFRSRSFNNTLLIWLQHARAHERGLVPDPMPTFVAGFKQWQALGHAVAKGQRGYAILAPVTGRFASSTPGDAASWHRLRRGERPDPGEVVTSRLVGVRPAYVWDVSQTTGPPIPETPVPELLAGEAPEGLWDELARLIDAAGFRLLEVADAGEIRGANGLTDFVAHTVAVRADMDPAARVKTLAHELAHVRMHGPTHDALAHRGIGEVEAESVALMIGAAHGMDTSAYTIPYVSSWATAAGDRSPAEVVQDTGERVRRVAVDILASLSTRQLGDGTPPELDPPARQGAGAASVAPPTRRPGTAIARGR